MTSPKSGVSGVGTSAVAGAGTPDFRTAVLPARGSRKPPGVPRQKKIDNLIRRVRKGDAKPQVLIPRILYYRRHVLREPLDQVLVFPYALIQWMRSLEAAADADLSRAFDLETTRECLLNLAQLAVAHDGTSISSFEKYFEASALYRASLDSSDAAVMALRAGRKAA